MALQVVLLNSVGGLVFDEPLWFYAINQVLVEENLSPLPAAPDDTYRHRFYGLGWGERLTQVWTAGGRVLPPELWPRLLRSGHVHYDYALQQQSRWPLIAGVVEFLQELHRRGIPIVLVAPQTQAQLEPILHACHLSGVWQQVVTGDPLGLSGTIASGQLHQQGLAKLGIPPQECLSIEATYAGIRGAQASGIPVLGLATLFPYQMLHRRTQWVVDSFRHIEWERLHRWYATGQDRPPLEPAPTPPEHAA
ncbi:MAG: HAD family phosphatase [Synechococcales cyanobacterium]